MIEIDCKKKIKRTENPPSGINILWNGGLAINMGEIKNIISGIDCIDIEYYDGTKTTWWPLFQNSETECPNTY